MSKSAVAIHLNCSIEAILMRTNNFISLRNKENINTISNKKIKKKRNKRTIWPWIDHLSDGVMSCRMWTKGGHFVWLP